jgi:hypothetical protein
MCKTLLSETLLFLYNARILLVSLLCRRPSVSTTCFNKLRSTAMPYARPLSKGVSRLPELGFGIVLRLVCLRECWTVSLALSLAA